MSVIQILTGLHPHPGWRSFKTEHRLTENFPLNAICVMAHGRRLHVEEGFPSELTPIGAHLLLGLSQVPRIHYIRFKDNQLEIFAHSWEDELPNSVMYTISRICGGDGRYNPILRDMRPAGDFHPKPNFYEEIEEIEEFGKDFVLSR